MTDIDNDGAETLGANGQASQKSVRDFAREAEIAARERAERLREQAKTYYDDAHTRFDEYQQTLTRHVQEKPIQSTLIAVGAGVVLGLLLAGRRR